MRHACCRTSEIVVYPILKHCTGTPNHGVRETITKLHQGSLKLVLHLFPWLNVSSQSNLQWQSHDGVGAHMSATLHPWVLQHCIIDCGCEGIGAP